MSLRMSRATDAGGWSSQWLRATSCASRRARGARFVTVAVTVALVAAIAGSLAERAEAQPEPYRPASALIFPHVGSADGMTSAVSVTNRNDDRRYCEETDFQAGDVYAQFVYVDGTTWTQFETFELLTPGDTLTVVTSLHAPKIEGGFLLVTANDPTNRLVRVDNDFLIGTATVVDSTLDASWSYVPYAFRAVGEPSDPCVDIPTDADADGAADFDGVEYAQFPSRLFIASFLLRDDLFGNRLTLMTTAGPVYAAEVDFLFWNNIEDKFSRSFRFVCWADLPLRDISAIAEGLGGDDSETGIPGLETGWVQLTPRRIVDAAGNPVSNADGGHARPPILGVFSERTRASEFSVGRLLHFDGTLDGLEIYQGDGDPQR